MTGTFFACPQLNVNFKWTKNTDQNLAEWKQIYKEQADASLDEGFSTLNKMQNISILFCLHLSLPYVKLRKKNSP